MCQGLKDLFKMADFFTLASKHIDRWMDGWMDGWVDEWVGGWMD